MKKIISCFTALIITVTMLCACSRDSSVVLFFAVESPASGFDPQIASGNTSRTIVRNCFEGLVSYDENGNIGEGVAESWDISEDGCTYTFRMRKNAQWHLTSNAADQLEGKLPENFPLAVTARDFVFALRRAVDPVTASSDAYMFMNIKNAEKIYNGNADSSTLGVTAVNENTLQITLEKPQSNFLEVLLVPAAMPCNETFFKACTGRYGTYIKFLLSNGPFYLSRFDDTSYRINKNPDYYGARTAKADAIWFYYLSDRAAMLEDLEDDDYSGALLSSEEYEAMRSHKNKSFTECGNIIRSLILNTADESLSEQELRLAIAEATDASLIAENAGKTPYRSYVPLSAADTDITVHPDIYNEKDASAKLKKALKTLGVSNVTLSVLCEKNYEELMRKLLQEWQRILGVSVSFSVESVTREELEARVGKGEYQIAFYPVKTETESVFEYFGGFTPSRSESITGYSDMRFTELLNSLYGGNKKDYEKIYSELEQQLALSACTVPVWSESSYYVYTKGVSGVIFKTGGDTLYLFNATN